MWAEPVRRTRNFIQSPGWRGGKGSSWTRTPTQVAKLSQLIRRTLVHFGGHRPTRALPIGDARQTIDRVMTLLGPDGLPENGFGAPRALDKLAELTARFGLNLSSPTVAAHLQPPPLAVAVAADTLANITNASVDTFDSGPSSIAVERWVIRTLVKLAGLGELGDGVMTPGGSISNLLGLLLARDRCARRLGRNASLDGVSVLRNPVVLCSAAAHFSVNRACAALGLGENAVIPVPIGKDRRLDPERLHRLLLDLRDVSTPIAVVATAGTTDFGTVDPLREIAAVARAHDVWLHADAAYGFGALFSDALAEKLDGIDEADSVTLDLHKLGWQPAATSVLLVANVESFGALDRNVDYLNPSDDAAAGYDGLLGRSLQTTRRADAIKVAATFLAFGRRGLGELVDACHRLAQHAELRIRSEAHLVLEAPAELTTVVFRYLGGDEAPLAASEINRLNCQIRRHLLEEGRVLIGRTTLPDVTEERRVCLKFTFVNPAATTADVDTIIEAVLEAGAHLERRETTERSNHFRPVEGKPS
ncbi:MAG: pyridoxal-dependent decarboxylase [Myxococcota bacterium]